MTEVQNRGAKEKGEQFQYPSYEVELENKGNQTKQVRCGKSNPGISVEDLRCVGLLASVSPLGGDVIVD